MTVSTDDVLVLLGRAFTGDEEDRASRLVEMAEAAVESALPGFNFTAGTETATLHLEDHDGILWTPKYPVTAITSVTSAGTALPSSAYTFNEQGRILVFDAASYVVNASHYDLWCGPVVVDYDFGLDPVPADMAGFVAGLVAGTLRAQGVNADGLRSESIDGYARTFSDAETAAAIGANLASLASSMLPRRWQRLRQVSVPLR